MEDTTLDGTWVLDFFKLMEQYFHTAPWFFAIMIGLTIYFLTMWGLRGRKNNGNRGN